MAQVLESYVGLQWGDEGKGKLIDEAVERARAENPGKRTVVVRYQGGANAGHSVYVRNEEGKLVKFVTHVSPSGLTNGADVAIGPQVAFNPIAFAEELESGKKLFGYDGRVLISERTGILMDYHKKIDRWYEEQSGDNAAVGSTKQGIGPFYMDNARRTTRLTVFEWASKRFSEKLRFILEQKKPELEAAGIWYPNYLEELIAQHDQARKTLACKVERLEYRIREYLERGDNILIEGGQGTGLDVDMGTIPDQTSSHLLAPHAFPGLGLPRREFRIIGVEKVYPSRVGKGHMPTLDIGEFGNSIVEEAGEFGATTKRRRRVGYPDWLYVKRSAMLNDCDSVIITRADNLQNRDVKACIAYQLEDGMQITEVPLILDGVRPVYLKKMFEWNLWDGPRDLSKPEDVDAALRIHRQEYVSKGFDSLPEDLRRYVEEHDSFVGVRTIGVSIGPARGETVWRK